MTLELAGAEMPVRRGELLLGKYLIGEVLGAGGMGVVVAAEHVQLGQKVAVKFLAKALREKPEAVERFVREARAAAQIRSEHVVRVVDVGGAAGDVCYMVMEHLDGQDLSQVLRARGHLPPADAVGMVLQACEAIAEAHGLGIVHRDLKPGNLFLTHRRDGSPLIKVLDFGISKAVVLEGAADGGDRAASLTSTRMVMGSPLYMSPEQLRSAKNVDARTDIWSLGVILHELLSGRPVFQADSPMEVLAMIAADQPTPLRQVRPEIPVALERLVLDCLEKLPARRVPTVGELARRLEPFAPSWAAASVGRIAASSPRIEVLGARGGGGGPTPAGERAGDGLPAAGGTKLLPDASSTSMQMSGELASKEAERRSAAPGESPAKGRFGVMKLLAVGAAVGVAGALMIHSGSSSSPASSPHAASRPSAVASARTAPEGKVPPAIQTPAVSAPVPTSVVPPPVVPAADSSSRAAAPPVEPSPVVGPPVAPLPQPTPGHVSPPRVHKSSPNVKTPPTPAEPGHPGGTRTAVDKTPRPEPPSTDALGGAPASRGTSQRQTPPSASAPVSKDPLDGRR